MYYAAVNSYATETSVGFANTWGVIGFATKSMRDAFVSRAKDLATRAIKTSDFKKYEAKRGEISYYDEKGEFYQAAKGYGPFKTGDSIDPKTAESNSQWKQAAAAYWENN